MAHPDPFEQIHEFLRSGDYQTALRLLRDPVSGRVHERFRHDLNHAWYVIGDIHYRNRNYTHAVVAFSRSIEDRSDDLEAIVALGNAYSELQEHKLSEKAFRQGLAFDAQNDALLYNLGNALFDQGRYHDAIETYNRVSDRDELLLMKAKRNIRASEDRASGRDA